MNKRTFKKHIRENGIDETSREFFKVEFLDGIEIADIDYIINLHLKMNGTGYLKKIKEIAPFFNKEQYEIYLDFKSKNKKDNGSDLFYQALYGREWEKRKKYINDLSKNTYESFVKRYGDEADLKWKEFKEKHTESTKHRKENMIKKNGLEKTEEILKKQYENVAFKNSSEYVYENYENPEEEIKRRKSNTSLESFIGRFGLEDGTHKYNKHCERISYTSSLEYYKEKYGNDGESKWNQYIEKQRFDSSEMGFIERFGNIEGKERYKNKMEKWSKSNSSISKASLKFFSELNNMLEDHLVFGEGKELKLSDGKRNYFYDACYQDKYAIEFHGDSFHGNPAIYGPEDNCHPFDKDIQAHQLWEADAKKADVANKNGYIYIYFWEKENPTQAYTTLLSKGIR